MAERTEGFCLRPDEIQWGLLLAEIRAARHTHARDHHQMVTELIRASQAAYEREVASFTAALHQDRKLAPFAGATLEHARAYLAWMHWVGWNAANLSPLLEGPLEDAAERLALATLGYAGGRLVDDGLDGHLSFKGRHDTVLGHLRRTRPDIPLHTSASMSVFLGLSAFQYTLRRLRRSGRGRLADTLDRTFTRISEGVLAECHVAGSMDRSAYVAIVRRKAVAYNMLLYRALIDDHLRAPPFRVLRILYEMDELAQLVNDFNDIDEDAQAGTMNAFVGGVYDRADAPALLRGRCARLWSQAAELGPRAAGPLAAMIDSVGVARFVPPPARSPGDGGAARARIDAAVERGLRFLEAAQDATGELRTYHSRSTAMTEPTHFPSPFVTAMVLLALEGIAPPATATIRERALAWLVGWRRPDGAVAFLHQGIDPDLDDTCLVSWALQRHHADLWPYLDLAESIRDRPGEGGLFHTWIRAAGERNDVDPCVSVNVLRFLHQNQIRADAVVAGLRQALSGDAVSAGTIYYESPAMLPYLVSTLPAPLRDRVAPPSLLREIAAGLLQRCEAPERVSIIDQAATLSLACRAGSPLHACARLADALLAAQGADGAWPAHAVFRAFDYWGSAELATALVIEALAAFATAPGRDDPSPGDPPG